MIISTIFPDLIIVKRRTFSDHRGVLNKIFDSKILKNFQLDDAYTAYSRDPKTVRGLHYQMPMHGQTKYVSCTSGAFLDIVLDLRPASPKYGEIFIHELNEENQASILVPAGFAHGIFTLRPNTTMLSLCQGEYRPELESGFSILDLGLNFIGSDIIISDKDKNLPMFEKTR